MVSMNFNSIVEQVAGFYNVKVDELIYGDRRRKFSEPRHVAMYLCNRILGMDNETIGEHFGKSRTSGRYAVKKIGDYVDEPRYNRRAAACVETILDNNRLAKK